MSLIHCKRIYSREGLSDDYISELQKLPLSELREISKVADFTLCEGFVIEADWTLNINKPTTEFVCLHCGRRFNFETRRYIKILDALGVNYKGRLP